MKKNNTFLLGLLFTALVGMVGVFAHAADDVNDAPMEGAAVVSVGSGCKACQANTSSSALKADDPHRYDALLPDDYTPDSKAKADKGTQ